MGQLRQFKQTGTRLVLGLRVNGVVLPREMNREAQQRGDVLRESEAIWYEKRRDEKREKIKRKRKKKKKSQEVEKRRRGSRSEGSSI